MQESGGDLDPPNIVMEADDYSPPLALLVEAWETGWF